MATSASRQQRFFLHYPEGLCLYVCIVDEKRRAFDFTDDTFKFAGKLTSIRDACLAATGKHESRADHEYSYSVEIDLARLLNGLDPETIPAEGAVVGVHWLMQIGDTPDVSADKRLHGSCSLRNVGGRFEPANKWDSDSLDENLAFEKRAESEARYHEFTTRESEVLESRHQRLAECVRRGDVAATVRILAEDLCFWAGCLKQHLLHQITHLAKEPFFVRTRDVPKDAPFQVFETWVIREWIGGHEAFDLLEFHKSADFARSFSSRMDRLHSARVQFSQQVVAYTVQHRGEDVDGVFVLDEARKDLKHMALGLAEYLDVIAQQLEATRGSIVAQPIAASAEAGTTSAAAGERPAAPHAVPQSGVLLGQFADSLGAYATVLNRIILDAHHPEIESFEDAIAWTTSRQAELQSARQDVERFAGRQLIAAVVPPEGAKSEEWTVQLLAMIAESANAASYVFTSGPPQSTSDDPKAKMAASVVARQLEVASNLLRDIESRSRHLEATCLSMRASESGRPEAALESQQFSGGEIVFYRDRVEICGIDVCSGPRSKSKRVLLELLSRRRDNGEFVAYGGDELEKAAQRLEVTRKAGGWIRDVRDDILERLRTQANIISGREDVIQSGTNGPGYRFADCLTVRYADPPTITDITDTDDATDVRNVDVRDVFVVRDDAAGARRAWILEELAKGHRLKAPDVAGQFDCSVKTAQRDFTVLKDDDKIEFVGPARTGYYRIRPSPEGQ